MKINVNIEEDAEFRAHVKELIAGQIRSILREELKGLIIAEIAKMKLLKPHSPALEDIVRNAVQRALDRSQTSLEYETKKRLDEAVRETMAPMRKTLNARMEEALSELIRQLKS